MKVYNTNNTPSLRENFIESINKVFDNEDDFMDLVENKHIIGFDIFVDTGESDEVYIIDRNTGEYINWYEFYHLGKTMSINFEPSKLVDFLTRFKNADHPYWRKRETKG